MRIGLTESKNFIQTPNFYSTPVPGSIVVFPVYTSNLTDIALSNSEHTITNTHPSDAVYVNTFFVDQDGVVSNVYYNIAAGESANFTAFDLYPGVTGYVIAIATNDQGIPINFDYLTGRENVYFSPSYVGSFDAYTIRSAASLQYIGSTLPLLFGKFSFSGFYEAPIRSIMLDINSDSLIVLSYIKGKLNLTMDQFPYLYDKISSRFGNKSGQSLVTSPATLIPGTVLVGDVNTIFGFMAPSNVAQTSLDTIMEGEDTYWKVDQIGSEIGLIFGLVFERDGGGVRTHISTGGIDNGFCMINYPVTIP